MSCWFQTAFESIGVSGPMFVDRYLRDMSNTSCGPQIKLTISGPNIQNALFVSEVTTYKQL
jgi:hypothetical protein